MKVLYFHQHFTTRSGSTGTRSYEMAQALLRRGHQVTMVCGSHGAADTGLVGQFQRGRRRGTVDGIDVIEFELPYSNKDGYVRRSFTFLLFAAQSTLVALREPTDLVFATTTPLTAGIPGILARLLRRRTMVFEVRDLWPELPRAMGVITNPAVLGAMGILEWASYHSSKRLIALSPGIRDGIVRRGIDPARVTVIPNGCDLDLFGGDVQPWRPDGVQPTDLLAVYTGTHGVANGLVAVLDAAAVLQRRGRTDIKLALVGDGKQRGELRARAEREALANVLFVNPMPKNQLTQLMRGADVGMQILADVPAFYFGTSPNKFFDYLAAGLPVLNNYPGWLAEMIVEHYCGFAVPPGDAEAFADALEAAADDRNALTIMGANATALAGSSFDRAALSRQFVLWLESAVPGSAINHSTFPASITR